ncbi:MAG: CHAT domain-containing protein [Chitinophagaceae bacterium]
MAIKVVFLAYANSQALPLPTLGKEDQEVFSSLVNETLKGNFIIHRESFATSESINKYLGKYDEIAVFHYSGHAGKEYFLLNDKTIFASGIPKQLRNSISNGSLKLVVLNGCSTTGQVKLLLELGVPAVIATSAPIDDYSATAFSIKFYQNLSESGMKINDAFQDAIGAAQNTTGKDLGIMNKQPRGINFLENTDPEKPLWEIFCRDASALEINPLPVQQVRGSSNFKVNKDLVDTLLNVLSEADDIKDLLEKEKKKLVETGDKHTAILNVMPFPIGIQLKKLLVPVSDVNVGYDKISIRRIEQIYLVFRSCMEFLGYIMLSQLWEEKQQREEKYENKKKLLEEKQLPVEDIFDDRINSLPDKLLQLLRQHFFATPEERQQFDYFSFIRAIREFFDSLNDNTGISYFIKELSQLRELLKQETPDGEPKQYTDFAEACHYFTELQKQIINKRIDGDDVIAKICEKAEKMLCQFFKQMGFLQEYKLTSIQNINFVKFRHKRKAEFNHSVVRLMRSTGGSDKLLYRWKSFIDNPGVVLLNGVFTSIDPETQQFEANDNLQFLNLSPFLMDSDAFDKESNQTTPMVYAQYIPAKKIYRFNKIDSPNISRDILDFGENSSYKTIWFDLEYYRKNMLMDPD